MVATLMLLVAGLTASCTIPKPAAAPKPLRIEVWGDSFSAQAEPYINFYLGLSRKATVRVHAFGATAMCDWFSDMYNETNPANPAGFHPQVVVLQFFGDAFTKCMWDKHGVALTGQALVNKYSADSRYAIKIFSPRGIPVYFMSTPLSIYQSKIYTRLSPLGEMFAGLPARFPARHEVRYINGATELELNGKFTYTLPCLSFEKCTGHWPDGTKTVVVRQSDGFHFCPTAEKPGLMGIPVCPVPMPGAQRFALAMQSVLHSDYGI